MHLRATRITRLPLRRRHAGLNPVECISTLRLRMVTCHRLLRGSSSRQQLVSKHRSIADCEWRLRTFVERDPYVNYDYYIRTRPASPDTITRDHVYAINNAIACRVDARRSRQSRVGAPPPHTAPDLAERLRLARGDCSDRCPMWRMQGPFEARRLTRSSVAMPVSVGSTVAVERLRRSARLRAPLVRTIGSDHR